MDRESSPTNHIAAANGSRAFDPLAFNAPTPAAPTSSAGGYENSRTEEEGEGRRLGDATDMDMDATPRAKGRPRNLRNQEEIEPVIDETGERVREGFREFLQR